jgi:hypothetical protein
MMILRYPETSNITWCRGSGKSFVMGLLAFFFAYRNRWKAVITAPTLQQTWNIMEHAHFGASKLLRRRDFLYDNRYEIQIRNRGSITCLSGSKTANQQGKHCHVLFCDEKQDLYPEVISESFIPMLGNYHGIMIMCGVGGDPASVGEVLGNTARYTHTYPYQEHIKYDPGYIKIVEQARKVMLPEEFQAHYEALPLSLASSLLIPRMVEWDGNINRNKRGVRSIVGLDFGKIDLTVGTLTHFYEGNAYIDKWFITRGSYNKQVSEIANWLNNEVEFDQIYAESNGVGDSVIDFLTPIVPQVTAIRIDEKWKDEKGRIANSLSRDGRMYYNTKHELATMFKNDVNNVRYKINMNRHLSIDHSDFISSLMMTLQEPRDIYI